MIRTEFKYGLHVLLKLISSVRVICLIEEDELLWNRILPGGEFSEADITVSSWRTAFLEKSIWFWGVICLPISFWRIISRDGRSFPYTSYSDVMCAAAAFIPMKRWWNRTYFERRIYVGLHIYIFIALVWNIVLAVTSSNTNMTVLFKCCNYEYIV